MSRDYEINLPPGQYSAKELLGDFDSNLKKLWERAYGFPFEERLCSPEFAISLANQCLSAKWNPEVEGEKVKALLALSSDDNYPKLHASNQAFVQQCLTFLANDLEQKTNSAEDLAVTLVLLGSSIRSRKQMRSFLQLLKRLKCYNSNPYLEDFCLMYRRLKLLKGVPDP